MAIDYYRVLGVMPGADDVVIRAALHIVAKRIGGAIWRG